MESFAEAEEFIEAVEDDVAFLVGEFAVWVAEFEDGFDCGKGGIAIFLEDDSFAGGAGKGVEEAGIVGAIGAEFKGAGFDAAEGLEDLKCGKLEGGLADPGVVEVAAEIDGGLLAVAGLFDPELLFAPILVTALFPFAEMADFEMTAGFAELFYDGGIAETVVEENIDLVADWFGEAGDVAGAARKAS